MYRYVRRLVFNALSFLLAGACLSGTATAAVVSYSDTITASGSIALRLFDPALGTLQSISFSSAYSSSAKFSGTITCPSSNCGDSITGIIEAGTSFTLGTIGNFYVDVQIGRTTCDPPRGSSLTCTTPTVTAQGNDSDAATDALTLALFTGLGTFSVTYDNLLGGFSVRSVQDASFTATAGVSYTYVPGTRQQVPESSSFALVGVAALLAARARRTLR